MRQRDGYGNPVGAMLLLVLILVVVGLLAPVQAQEADTPLPPYGTSGQLSRSMPWVRRINPTAAGAITTMPANFFRGSKVVEVCNWSAATCLYLENVQAPNGGTAAELNEFMAITLTSLSVLPAGACRSLGAQVSNVATRVETGESDLAMTFTDVTGGAVEIKVWK